MSDDCLFCKIASGKIPVQRLAEDDVALAFPDLNPQAPTHVLVIPKVHVASLVEVAEGDWPVMGRVLGLAAKVAKQLGLDGRGYRTVINSGPDAGQSVHHLHVHLLGGRSMLWPPG